MLIEDNPGLTGAPARNWRAKFRWSSRHLIDSGCTGDKKLWRTFWKNRKQKLQFNSLLKTTNKVIFKLFVWQNLHFEVTVPLFAFPRVFALIESEINGVFSWMRFPQPLVLFYLIQVVHFSGLHILSCLKLKRKRAWFKSCIRRVHQTQVSLRAHLPSLYSNNIILYITLAKHFLAEIEKGSRVKLCRNATMAASCLCSSFRATPLR